MSIELILCVVMMLIASRVSTPIMLHYGAFFGANLFFIGYESADSSILAIVFSLLCIIDVLLVIYGRASVLLVSAVTSLALSFESIGNGDWLLNHSTHLSIATNAVIIGSLIKEYVAWMRGRSAH